MARPTKLTPAFTKRICASIKRCCGSLEAAVAPEGISRTTLHEWRQRGRTGEEPFAAFLEQTETAREAGKLKALSAIARDRSWTSRAWLLERSFPLEYSLQATRLHAHVASELDAALDRVKALVDAGRLSSEQYGDVCRVMAGFPDPKKEAEEVPDATH